MARYIFVDVADSGGFTVRVLSGLRSDTTRHFDNRAEARRYANGKLGRQGCILDTTDMTPEQLATHRARAARNADLLARFNKQEEQKRK